MKKILIITLMLAACKLSAQTSVYHPFPDNCAVWTQFFESCCAASCPGPPYPNPVLYTQNFSYAIQGDTLINGNTYHKLYRSGTSHEHCAFGSVLYNWMYFGSSYYGAYRNDILAKKILMPGLSGQELVLYNFNMVVGDTIGVVSDLDPGCIVTVTSVDSMFIGNDYRKRFNLSNNEAIIEGIGCTQGMFEMNCPFESGGSLTCFTDCGVNIYPDSTTVCDILTGISKAALPQDNFSVAPNPLHTIARLEFSAPFAGAEFTLFDLYGRPVKHMHINKSPATIDRAGLVNGVYIYRVIGSSGSTASGKLIIE
jgi:hypothetical protein